MLTLRRQVQLMMEQKLRHIHSRVLIPFLCCDSRTEVQDERCKGNPDPQPEGKSLFEEYEHRDMSIQLVILNHGIFKQRYLYTLPLPSQVGQGDVYRTARV